MGSGVSLDLTSPTKPWASFPTPTAYDRSGRGFEARGRGWFMKWGVMREIKCERARDSGMDGRRPEGLKTGRLEELLFTHA